MAEINLKSIAVEFPIYDVTRQSLRHEIIRIGTGGVIRQSDRDFVVVRALEDISLHLTDGDRLALIGHNGAGKTTLLRILAGIFEPTRGEVTIEGRVAPLFDITLGMDREATGFENIRVRGLFLGMRPEQIEAHTEEIVEFSDLGDYIHVPIRTYSAGMLVRLAFAISTAMSPDILLLDEMISAGDANFIERAQARLSNFLNRTGILVVASHAPDVLRDLCNKAILLEHGRVMGTGSVDEMWDLYREISANSGAIKAPTSGAA